MKKPYLWQIRLSKNQILVVVNYILFSTFSAEFVTASPALDTSLPTPLKVLQPDKTKANNIETAKIFFITISVPTHPHHQHTKDAPTVLQGG
jgi:hypothetical protein